MAITWAFQIEVLDYDKRHVSIAATRTDSEDAENPVTYTLESAHIETSEQQLAALEAIWAMHTAALSLEAKKVTFAPIVAALEAAAKINLEAREA